MDRFWDFYSESEPYSVSCEVVQVPRCHAVQVRAHRSRVILLGSGLDVLSGDPDRRGAY